LDAASEDQISPITAKAKASNPPTGVITEVAALVAVAVSSSDSSVLVASSSSVWVASEVSVPVEELPVAVAVLRAVVDG
jgi:hypothetical protein